MLKVPVYNQKGEKVGEQDLNPEIFGLEIKEEVIHQVVVSLLANQRHNFAHAKNKSEVRGGGKKPWRQKGSGRARAGSTRSPLWRGGGIIFGPNKDRNYSQKINKKLKRKVLLMCFSEIVKQNQLYIIDKIDLAEIKTKAFFMILNKIIPDYSTGKENKKVIFSLPEKDLNLISSARNIENLKILPVTNLNILDCLKYNHLVLNLQGIKKVQEYFSNQ